jgi:hypothetical protein
MLDIQRKMIEKGLANAEDFDYSGALRSKITFKALVIPWEISERHRIWVNDEGEKETSTYWLIKDKYGASFSSKDEHFINRVREFLCVSLCEVKGTVRIVRGGTYLNAERCEPFDIEAYVTEKDGTDTSMEDRGPEENLSFINEPVRHHSQ